MSRWIRAGLSVRWKCRKTAGLEKKGPTWSSPRWWRPWSDCGRGNRRQRRRTPSPNRGSKSAIVRFDFISIFEFLKKIRITSFIVPIDGSNISSVAQQKPVRKLTSEQLMKKKDIFFFQTKNKPLEVARRTRRYAGRLCCTCRGRDWRRRGRDRERRLWPVDPDGRWWPVRIPGQSAIKCQHYRRFPRLPSRGKNFPILYDEKSTCVLCCRESPWNVSNCWSVRNEKINRKRECVRHPLPLLRNQPNPTPSSTLHRRR